MQISCFIYTVMFTRALVVTGVLHSVRSELVHQGSTLLIHRLVAVQFSYNHVATCTAFVWCVL